MEKENCKIQSNEKVVKKVTLWGLLINLLLSALKVAAGYLGNSQAVLADGIHSASDSVTDVTVIVGASFWSAPPDDDHPYGHGRIETAITVFIGLLLVGVALGMGYNAVDTFNEKSDSAPGTIAFAAAILSIIVKEILYRWNKSVGERVKSSAMVANAWHHRSDAFSSIPAAVAVIVSQLYPQIGYVDNIGAIIVCLFILYAAYKISWKALRDLIDTSVEKDICNMLENIARGVEGVEDVHKCRSRFFGSGMHVDLHVLVDPELTVKEGHDISRAVRKTLIEKGPDVIDVIVHLEPYEG